MIPITIEDMEKKDIKEVMEIEKASFPSPWSRETFLTGLNKRNLSFFLVAKGDSRVVGYAGFWLIFDEVYVTNLAVHSDYRRKGIGERLMKFLLRLAKARGAKRATLEVRLSNLAAQNLYKKFGFKVGGVQKGYYTNTGEEALVMYNKNLGSL